MTFPAFRPQLASCLTGEARDGFESIALVAHDGDTPVGLVLAQAPLTAADGCGAESPKTARLLSISIVPAWRRRGVASRLMLSLEEELRQRACVSLTTGYTTRMPAWRQLERLLAACRWSPPEASMLMSMGYIREVAKAPWLNALCEAPPGFELFEWSQLGIGERAQLQEDVAAGTIPRGLSPFADEEDSEPTISVGVRHNNEVVAWMIVIRSPWVPNALCYRSQFVRPQMRVAQALGPLTLAEAIRRHAASPIETERPEAVFGISFENAPKQVNFFRKRLAPFCSSTYESHAALKALA
jgi:GNAT superfamily N-acetyltransferase